MKAIKENDFEIIKKIHAQEMTANEQKKYLMTDENTLLKIVQSWQQNKEQTKRQAVPILLGPEKNWTEDLGGKSVFRQFFYGAAECVVGYFL